MATPTVKKNKNRTVRLYSTENTGIFYNFTKPKSMTSGVIELNKYDKKLRRVVVFSNKHKKKK